MDEFSNITTAVIEDIEDIIGFLDERNFLFGDFADDADG